MLRRFALFGFASPDSRDNWYPPRSENRTRLSHSRNHPKIYVRNKTLFSPAPQRAAQARYHIVLTQIPCEPLFSIFLNFNQLCRKLYKNLFNYFNLLTKSKIRIFLFYFRWINDNTWKLHIGSFWENTRVQVFCSPHP